MTVTQRLHTRVAFVVLIVVGIAAADWVLQPAKAQFWSIAIATALVMWLVVAAMGRARSFEDYSDSERRFLLANVIAAGLILSAALLKHMSDALGFAAGDISDRVVGIGSGLVLVVMGNTLPKVLAPLTAKRCGPSTVQSIQRLAGWTLVLAGIASIAMWVTLPPDTALTWSMIATGTAVALIVLRCAWAILGPRTRSSPTV